MPNGIKSVVDRGAWPAGCCVMEGRAREERWVKRGARDVCLRVCGWWAVRLCKLWVCVVEERGEGECLRGEDGKERGGAASSFYFSQLELAGVCVCVAWWCVCFCCENPPTRVRV